MKLSTEERDVVKSQEFETISYGVDTKNLPLLFQMLRTNLYADLYGSIIRELVSNVIDSHTEANKPETLGEVEWVEPNRGLGIDCQLIIRDYGIGLSPDRIKNVYGNYLSSTKRDSNDQIGGFGLGSKVPFAYSDSFFVQTTFDGVKTKYLCYIDKTQLGAISVLEQKETTQANQTEIIIPIKDVNDKSSFQKAIYRQLSYFKTIKYLGFEAPKTKVLFEDETCIVMENPPIDNAHIVLGNIAYEIDFAAIGIDVKNNWQDPECVKSCGVGIKVDIGEIQPTLSREGLYWSEGTKKLVRAKMEKARKAIAKKLTAEVAAETDYAKWYGLIETGGTATLPRQWKFAKMDRNTHFKSTVGNLTITSSADTWFQDYTVRVVTAYMGGGRRRTRATVVNPDYTSDIATDIDLRDLPAYSITDKLNARTCKWLFKTHSRGFIVVKYAPDKDDKGVPMPINNAYSKATAAWVSKLPSYDAVPVPNDAIVTNFELQEAARREELKLRKLEGRYVAKILCLGDPGVGTGAPWETRHFVYSMYNGKFEKDKEAKIVYGFQEDHEKLCKVASFLNLSEEFKKWWQTTYQTRDYSGPERILFLKISREHAKTFAMMPLAHYVDNVLELKTPLNKEMSQITTALSIKPFIHVFHILNYFNEVNKSMYDKYVELHQFVEDYANDESFANTTSIAPFLKINSANLDTTMESYWKEIKEYFKDVELLSCPNFSMYSKEHQGYHRDDLGTTSVYLKSYVKQNKAAIKKYLLENDKAVDGQPGKSKVLVHDAPTVEQVTRAQDKLDEVAEVASYY